jgi:hypothetical protein
MNESDQRPKVQPRFRTERDEIVVTWPDGTTRRMSIAEAKEMLSQMELEMSKRPSKN